MVDSKAFHDYNCLIVNFLQIYENLLSIACVSIENTNIRRSCVLPHGVSQNIRDNTLFRMVSKSLKMLYIEVEFLNIFNPMRSSFPG